MNAGEAVESDGGIHASERLLVSGCVRGDENAWERLLKEYGPFINNVIKKYLPDPGDSQELFIHVLERLWDKSAERLAAWNGAARLSTYLAAITSRLCIDHLRHTGRRLRRTVSLHSAIRPAAPWGMEPDPATEALQSESRRILDGAMLQLNQDEQDILRLFYWQGMKYTEISSIMQRPVVDVGRKICRARKKLRVLLRESGIKNIGDLLE